MSFSVTHDLVIPTTSRLYYAMLDSKEVNLFIVLLALVYMHMRSCCNLYSFCNVSFRLFTMCDVSFQLFTLCDVSFQLFTLCNVSFQLFTLLLSCTGLDCVYIITLNFLSFSPQPSPSSVVHSLDLL